MEYWKPQTLEIVNSEEAPAPFHETMADFFSAQSRAIIDTLQTPTGKVVTVAGLTILAATTLSGGISTLLKTPTSQEYQR